MDYGADLTKRNDAEMNCFDEIVKGGFFELLECVYPYTRLLKRSSSAQVGDSLIKTVHRVNNISA